MSDAESKKDATRKDAALKITIPADLAGCKALIEQLACTIEQLHREKEDLELAFVELLQRAFRRRSERYINNPNQLRLDFKGTDEAVDAAEGLAQAVEESGRPVKAHTRRRPGRKPRNEALPEHLPRYEVEAGVPEHVKHCPKHGERTLIGHDLTETLEFERPKLRVRVTKYPKYACSHHPDCGLASPERPTGLVEGDRYDTSVAAEIITAKYGFHLPVYRQQDLFAGCGWTPQRSTLLNILVASAFVIRPLAEYFKRVVLASDVVGTDDTHVTLLLPATIPKVDPDDPKSQRAHDILSKAAAEGRRSVRAHMWAYRSVIEPLNVFDFTVSWHRDGPAQMLADFSGTLVADCYSGYEGIALGSNGRIRRAACGAHARRKVFDTKEAYPVESSLVLAKFQQLYDIEDQAKGMSPEERAVLRQSAAAKVWDSLDEWLRSDAAARVLPKSKFGEALGYIRNQWKPLQFIGSVPAGQRAADFITLVSSAWRNDLDVWSYIKDVLDRLLAGETDYATLRPDSWRQTHPEAIREYRVSERRNRADRKQYRRAARRRNTPKPTH